MTNLQEVPTEELLSFQDFPPVHNPTFSNTTIPATTTVNMIESKTFASDLHKPPITNPMEENPPGGNGKSFWSLEYYQKFFDVDTDDVIDRMVASIIPSRTNLLAAKIKLKPDLYGPFWISVTLIFTIAISGNVAEYLQNAGKEYIWKYNFHLVSYAATTIILYISIIPLVFWGLLKWSSEVSDLDGIEESSGASPLEIICIYGYSLFIYIPVSILWTIQISWFQWMLVVLATVLSGSVLMYTLLPALRLSRHKFSLMLGVFCCHLLLAAGFMLYFFHVPSNPIVVVPIVPDKPTNSTG